MDGKPGAGSPLLCRTLLACLLLLTGLNVKADTNTASSQQTLETPTHVPTEVFGSTENAATAIPTVRTSVKTEMLTTNEILKNSGLSTDDTNSVNTITMGSDLTQTTVATSHNVWTSSNPSTKRPDNTSSSKSSTSKPSTSNSTEYTSGPTGSTTQTVTTETPTPNPTKHTSGPTESSTVTATIETHNPNSTMPTSGPTESSTEPDTHSSATVTGGTDQSGITKSTGITQSTTENITSTSKTVSPETTEPAPPQSEPTIGKTQTTSTTDITPEHNVELPRALSSGSVAAITVIVIVLVLLIFGGAAFWKIRHSSYGRLLEDQDYGSLGNYNNPLYDDS